MKKIVIFDLDGTLIDSVADLAQSTNFALQKLGFPTHPVKNYHMMVGNGIHKLFERALPNNKRTKENLDLMTQLFLTHYGEHYADHSTPYQGIPSLLEILQQQNIQIAVASNKYQKGVESIVSHFFPRIKFTATLGQRTGIPKKPDPTIIHEIQSLANVELSDILYVGDSGVDMETAHAAKVYACGVSWGIRSREELEKAKADCIVDFPSQILSLIGLTTTHQ